MKRLENLDLNSKKYIIFDMDGTLIDSIGIWNLTDYRLIKHYFEYEVDLECIQKDRDSFLEEHQETDIYLEYCRYLVQKYHMKMTAEELFKRRLELSREILETDMDYKPDVVNLIYRLKDLGFTLVLATITIQRDLDIYSYKNKKMSSKMNLMEVFDYITKFRFSTI